MINAGVTAVGQQSDALWKSLRYFNSYRVCIAGLLFLSVLLQPSSFSLLSSENRHLHLAVTSVYLLVTTISLAGVHFWRRRFNMQLSLNVLADILVFTLLMHAGGGLRSGLGAMFLVMLAGAGLVGQGRLVLFYAAVATIAVLVEQSWRAVVSDFEIADFFQAGLFCAALFCVAIIARLLASRVIANEDLARRRGVELSNQILISRRVIEEMQDGVLVIGCDGGVKLHNPRAEQLLGLGDPTGRMLVDYSTELARGFASWCQHASDLPLLVRAPASGMQLRARFVSTDSAGGDVLVFLEDTGRLQEQARQLKLAALGRLTANIAHEIRNPLSAITHAGELVREDCHDPVSIRLLNIMLDNAQRVERIVSDVLDLGRRDRAHREKIDLRQALPNLIEEYTLKEAALAGITQVDCRGIAILFFDRSHFHQVMWNLLGNALRYSSGGQ